MLRVRHLIEPEDFTKEELEEIFVLADEIIDNPGKFSKSCSPTNGAQRRFTSS